MRMPKDGQWADNNLQKVGVWIRTRAIFVFVPVSRWIKGVAYLPGNPKKTSVAFGWQLGQKLLSYVVMLWQFESDALVAVLIPNWCRWNSEGGGMRVAADASFTCVFCVNWANEKLFSSLNHSCSNDKDIDTADADVSSFILYFFKTANYFCVTLKYSLCLNFVVKLATTSSCRKTQQLLP